MYKNQLNDDHKYQRIIVLSIHGEYWLGDAPIKCKPHIIVNHYSLRETMGEGRTEWLMAKITKSLGIYELSESNGHWNDICEFSGTIKDLKETADRALDWAIPIIYESGADNDHYDYCPSLAEEVLQLCVGIDYIEGVQRLYDSLWEGPPTHLRKEPKGASYPWVIEAREKGEDMSAYLEWANHSAYYPPDDTDPRLYAYFEKIPGLSLHKDHPRD